jgi:hydroxymethylbilane synthase
LARLEGGCQLPIGGHAAFSHNGTRLHMDALVGTPDGSQVVSAGNDEVIEEQSPEGRLELAHALGVNLADRMLAKGAGQMIEQARELARQRGWKG